MSVSTVYRRPSTGGLPACDATSVWRWGLPVRATDGVAQVLGRRYQHPASTAYKVQKAVAGVSPGAALPCQGRGFNTSFCPSLAV